MDQQKFEKIIPMLNYQLFEAQQKVCLLETELSFVRTEKDHLARSVHYLVRADLEKSRQHTETSLELSRSKEEVAALTHRLKTIFVGARNRKMQSGASVGEAAFIEDVLKDLADVMQNGSALDQTLAGQGHDTIPDWSDSVSSASI